MYLCLRSKVAKRTQKHHRRTKPQLYAASYERTRCSHAASQHQVEACPPRRIATAVPTPFGHKNVGTSCERCPDTLQVADEGFEPPKAVPADLQSAPVGRLGNLPYSFIPLAHPFMGCSSERFITIPNEPSPHQFGANPNQQPPPAGRGGTRGSTGPS